MRRARAVVAGLAGLALGGPAGAQEPPAGAGRPSTRLVVERGDGSASCPPDGELRQAVAARLGWDPFRSDATDATRLTLWREGRQLVARVDRRADDGTPLGSRTLTSQADDCRELADAVTFAIAVAIDPTSFTRAPAPLAPVVPVPAPVDPPRPLAPPPAPPLGASPPPAPLVEAPRPPVDDGPRWQPFGGAAVHTAFLAAPSPAPGASIHGGLRHGVGSARIEARFDVPVEGASEGVPGVVESQILAGALVPCGHLDPVALCGVVAVGALRGVGHEVDAPSDDATAIVALGPRLEVEARLSPLVGVFAHVDGLVTFPRTTLQLDGRDALALPLASLVIAVGGRLHPGAPARTTAGVTEVAGSTQER